MRIIKASELKVIEYASQVLKAGGLIIFPTETAYGVGVDATNPEAVSKLLEYKKRPEGKAISIGCSSKKMAEKYVEINESAENIYKEFLPGPVTVISKSKGNVDKRLESEKGTLGIRIPDHKLVLEIIENLGKPITTTSANSAGKKTPYSINDIFNNISDKQRNLIDLVIDAGELPKNLTSTVIDTTGSDLQTFRQGTIDFSKTEKDFNIYYSDSVEETMQLGEDFMKAKLYDLQNSPVIFLLRGKLGAGKTHFTKGIARALGITQNVKSPTYTYVTEYKFHRESEFQLASEPEKGNQEVGVRSRPAWRTDRVSGEQKTENRGSLQARPDAKVKEEQITNHGSPITNPLRTPSTEHRTLYHIDAWRVENKSDLEMLGFESWLQAGNVLVIEWPEVIINLIGNNIFNNYKTLVNVELSGTGEERELKVS